MQLCTGTAGLQSQVRLVILAPLTHPFLCKQESSIRTRHLCPLLLERQKRDFLILHNRQATTRMPGKAGYPTSDASQGCHLLVTGKPFCDATTCLFGCFQATGCLLAWLVDLTTRGWTGCGLGGVCTCPSASCAQAGGWKLHE